MSAASEKLRRNRATAPWVVAMVIDELLRCVDDLAQIVPTAIVLMPDILPLLPPQLPPAANPSIWDAIRPLLDDAELNITVERWLLSDDDHYRQLYGPQALVARQFGRIDPHWYLDGGAR